MKVLHDELAPGTRHLKGVLETLPDTLDNDEVVIACYTHDEDGEIVVAGYYTTKGYYEDGRIARPDGYRGDISKKDSKYSIMAQKVCNLEDCWAGGDTGGFYYDDEEEME